VPLHAAFLLAAGVMIHERFIPMEPLGPGYLCGVSPSVVEFDRVTYPRERLDRKAVVPDAPLAFLPAKPSGDLGLNGLPERFPFHDCGSCCCFVYLYELPPSVLMALELRWWRPEVLRKDETFGDGRLELRSIERRKHGFRVGIYTWR
jgi:hypothetical protein